MNTLNGAYNSGEEIAIRGSNGPGGKSEPAAAWITRIEKGSKRKLKGSITAGKLADYVVLAEDPYSIAIDALNFDESRHAKEALRARREFLPDRR